MKVVISILAILFVLFACKEDNPRPTAFLEYDQPYYQDMDGDLLLGLNEEIEKGTFGDIHSLIILKNGRVIFENYYSNYQRDDLHPLDGTTQSVVSAVVGTEEYLDENFTLSAKIIDYFPEYAGYFDNIPQKDQIEIKHLMSHTSGFWWDEWTHPFGTQENDAYAMSQSDDWIANVLATPMIKEPGSNFNFNSGNAVLLAPILEKETGMDLESLTKERLFDPLEISEWKWEKTPGGFVNAAWGLYLKPIDLAKIGYLYLQNGSWGDKVIFDEIWKVRSTRRRNSVSFYYGYGYFWWGFSHNSDIIRYLSSNDVFFSWGGGGQFLFVIPHLDLVIVTTAGNYNDETKAMEILRDYILTSVRRRFP